ncbi:hypothetical protein EMCRGX_G005942, partial [Ephydatia muelleri]
MKLFLINYSVNDRQKEEEAVEVFKQYLKLCEGDNVQKLEDVLQFFSGCSQVPVTGFPTQAVLSFDKNSSLPSASTCSIELFIPLKFSSLDDFKTHMNEALQHQ